MTAIPGRRFARYVAIGDSSTEGLDDPDGRGGFRGWADRLAEHLAAAHGNVRYANLAIRGRRTRQVLEEQLAPALALRPDLVTVFTGTNDVVAWGFAADGVGRDLQAIHRPLIAAGATVLTFTLPDLSPVMPLAHLIRQRIARLNETIRSVAAESGALLLDFAAIPATADARLWSADRFHANSEGHARMAAALAGALALPGFGAGWDDPLPGRPAKGWGGMLRAELAWLGGHFLPWILRHLQGRSSGDAIQPKRPRLEWVHPIEPGPDPRIVPAG